MKLVGQMAVPWDRYLEGTKNGLDVWIIWGGVFKNIYATSVGREKSVMVQKIHNLTIDEPLHHDGGFRAIGPLLPCLKKRDGRSTKNPQDCQDNDNFDQRETVLFLHVAPPPGTI